MALIYADFYFCQVHFKEKTAGCKPAAQNRVRVVLAAERLCGQEGRHVKREIGNAPSLFHVAWVEDIAVSGN